MSSDDTSDTGTDTAPRQRRERRQASRTTQGAPSKEKVLAKFRRITAALKREIRCMKDAPLHRSYRWGGWFTFICKHRLWRHLKYQDLDAYTWDQFELHDSAAYDYARLFRTIPKALIMEAGKGVLHKDAMLIVKMNPVPQKWIIRVLWDYLVWEKCRDKEMKRIVDGVQAALAALAGKEPPGEEWLRQVIEEARREDPTEVARRSLDKMGKAMGKAAKNAVELLEMLETPEGVDKEALQDKAAEVWEERDEMEEEVARLKEALRLTTRNKSGSSPAGGAGPGAKIPRPRKTEDENDDPDDDGDLEDDDPDDDDPEGGGDDDGFENEAEEDEAEEDNDSPQASGQKRGQQEQGPQASTQDQEASGQEQGQQEQDPQASTQDQGRQQPDQQASTQVDALAQRGAAPRPEQWSPDQVRIPVNYPALPSVSRLAVQSCFLIAAMDVAGTTMARFRDLHIGEGMTVHPRLKLLACRAIDRFLSARSIILPALDEIAASGQAQLDARAALAPGSSPRDHFPLSLDPARGAPMTWLSYEALDPLMSDDPTRCEVFVWHFLGLVDHIEKLTQTFCELVEQGQAMPATLACQLHTALLDTGGRMSRFRVLCEKEAQVCARQEEAQEAALATFRQQAQSRIITLGENALAAQYVIVGMTQDGRLIAISLNTPQLILGLGRQGAGKSHLAVLLMEGAAIPWQGTGHLEHPIRVIRIGGDWHQGVSGDSLKAGFYPNPDPTQWAYLQNYYGVPRGNAAFRGGYLFCLKESLERFQHKFADLVRRGLIILPLEMDPSEMAHYGYASYLTGGVQGRGKDRPAWKTLIDNIISWQGEDLVPRVLLRELKRHKLDHRVLGAVKMQLRQLGQIVVKGHYLVDKLERGWPLIVYLESRYLGQDQVLPLELAVMNALSRPMRNGEDPPRIIVMDEFNANLMSEGTAPLILEAASQLRHRPIWYYLSGQRITDFPAGIGALVTILAVFNTPSAAEFRREQEIFGVLHGMKYHRDIFPLLDGRAIMAGVRASDRCMVDQGMVAILRPSLVHAMGETYRVIG